MKNNQNVSSIKRIKGHRPDGHTQNYYRTDFWFPEKGFQHILVVH